MDMILAVCLLADLTRCREERINISVDPVGPHHCMMVSQPIIAEWTQAHPKWTVTRWRCVPAGTKEIEA
jgi:hypothetical protein